MKSSIRFLIFLAFCIFYSPELKATHLLGADLTYKCIGGNDYEITVSVYRDCAPGTSALDVTAKLRIFTLGTLLFNDYSVPRDTIIQVDLIPEDTCAIIPPDLCIEKGIYILEVTLPDSLDGFEINYQRCCMGANTNNILNPQDVGMNLTALIPPKAFSPCFSSPVFNKEPLLAICLDEITSADFGASLDTNLPGVLDHKFYTPFKGASTTGPTFNLSKPYSPVTWLAGFTATSAINSTPPITLDNLTGEFICQANDLGYFLMAEEVLVKDSLNQIVGRIDRVFRYTVADCSAGEHKVPITSVLGNNIQVCLDDDYTFVLGSPNTTSNLAWIMNGDTLGKDNTVNHNFNKVGDYTVELHGIAHPDDCYDHGMSQVIVSVFDIRPSFSSTNYLCAGEEAQFVDTTILPIDFSYSCESRVKY